jgi:hypothetical protein
MFSMRQLLRIITKYYHTISASAYNEFNNLRTTMGEMSMISHVLNACTPLTVYYRTRSKLLNNNNCKTKWHYLFGYIFNDASRTRYSDSLNISAIQYPWWPCAWVVIFLLEVVFKHKVFYDPCPLDLIRVRFCAQSLYIFLCMLSFPMFKSFHPLLHNPNNFRCIFYGWTFFG